MGRIRINGIDLDAQAIPQVTVAASGTLPATVRGTVQSFNATAGALTATLPTSPSLGDFFWTVKADSSVNRVTIRVGVTDVAWLSAQGDEVLWYFNGTIWSALSVNLAPLQENITVTGAWTKPPLAKRHDLWMVSAGGGGGSGRTSTTGTAAFGGGAGGNGTWFRESFLDSELPASVNITIGAGGTGGASIVASSTNGAVGSAGGNTVFGSANTDAFYRVARGGTGGAGGTTSTGTAGNNYAGSWFGLNNPAAGSLTVPSTLTNPISTAGFGGGITAGNAPTNGNSVSTPMAGQYTTTLVTTPAPGAVPGGVGSNAVAPFPTNINPTTITLVFAPSGGAASINSAAGKGGDANSTGVFGIGGGGGGAARDTFASGAGGRGADGVVIMVTTY